MSKKFVPDESILHAFFPTLSKPAELPVGMKVRKPLDFVLARLDSTDVRMAQRDAFALLKMVTGKNAAEVLAMKLSELTEEHQMALDILCAKRREERIPIQYLQGFVPFGDLEILVKPPVLIPRIETEEWVLWLIDEIRTGRFADLPLDKSNLILDLCSGSGCIGLLLASEFDETKVVGVDINKDAIALARKNGRELGIRNIAFFKEDLEHYLAETTQNFSLIVCNPPYISLDEIKSLSPEVLWEHFDALVAGENGLACYRSLLRGLLQYEKNQKIKQSPIVVVEIGATQRTAVIALFEEAGYCVLSKKDFNGHDRVICAWKVNKETINEAADA